MTPGHPWRRRWRDQVAPILWLLAVCMLIGAALGAGISHAAPSPGQQVAAEHAADICIALDQRPTVPGVVGVLTGLRALGLSDRESGVAVAESVIYVCPIHEALLKQFVARYSGERLA